MQIRYLSSVNARIPILNKSCFTWLEDSGWRKDGTPRSLFQSPPCLSHTSEQAQCASSATLFPVIHLPTNTSPNNLTSFIYLQKLLYLAQGCIREGLWISETLHLRMGYTQGHYAHPHTKLYPGNFRVGNLSTSMCLGGGRNWTSQRKPTWT